MKLLELCVAVAIAAGVMAVPHVAKAQALGEAATLSAGVSSTGSASGSAMSHRLGRAMRGEGHRAASSSKTSTSGGVVNLHWSREELRRSARATRGHARGNAKVGSKKAQPDFVVVGADPPDADSGEVSVSQPKAVHPSTSQRKPSSGKGSSGHAGNNQLSASH